MKETKTPLFSEQLSGLSTITGKVIKYCDNISGVSHKCFVSTLKQLLTTNRTTTGGDRIWFSVVGIQDHCLGARSWDSSTSRFSEPSARKALLCRMDWVPGPSPLLGLTQPGEQGAFMGDHRCLYTKWQFSSSIIPCYCITRSYREASISFLRF